MAEEARQSIRGAVSSSKKTEEDHAAQEIEVDDMILKKYEVDILRAMYTYHLGVLEDASINAEGQPVKPTDNDVFLEYAIRTSNHSPDVNNPPAALTRTSIRNTRFFTPIDLMRNKSGADDDEVAVCTFGLRNEHG